MKKKRRNKKCIRRKEIGRSNEGEKEKKEERIGKERGERRTYLRVCIVPEAIVTTTDNKITCD